MRHQPRPYQYDLYSNQPETPRAEALPLANQAEAILLLGKLLYEIVQAEAKAAKTGGSHEQDHR